MPLLEPSRVHRSLKRKPRAMLPVVGSLPAAISRNTGSRNLVALCHNRRKTCFCLRVSEGRGGGMNQMLKQIKTSLKTLPDGCQVWAQRECHRERVPHGAAFHGEAWLAGQEDSVINTVKDL